jgi:DNA adenine methylase
VDTAPHFLPYQGSKRRLAHHILAHLGNWRPARLFEPFAGSAALSLAAVHRRQVAQVVLGDSLAPLMQLWQSVLTAPDSVANDYERLWRGDATFEHVRARYNAAPEPVALLYLLARCVKNAPRWNEAGAFNQAPDRRRRGVAPDRLRRQLRAVAALLHGRCELRVGDARQTVADATAADLVYLDPPWQGTSSGRDRRYHAGFSLPQLLELLNELRNRRVPFLLSYDGQLGERRYGEPLPLALGLRRVMLDAGRSSQATLAGRAERTLESLYISAEMPTR